MTYYSSNCDIWFYYDDDNRDLFEKKKYEQIPHAEINLDTLVQLEVSFLMQMSAMLRVRKVRNNANCFKVLRRFSISKTSIATEHNIDLNSSQILQPFFLGIDSMLRALVCAAHFNGFLGAWALNPLSKGLPLGRFCFNVGRFCRNWQRWSNMGSFPPKFVIKVGMMSSFGN